jgi:hypothetical protein
MGQWRGKGVERSWERLCQGALKGIEGLEAQGGEHKKNWLVLGDFRSFLAQNDRSSPGTTAIKNVQYDKIRAIQDWQGPFQIFRSVRSVAALKLLAVLICSLLGF